ncbi:MAG: helix-turn-helix transcriptional regulator [Casimicrobiaceae bacterium]
MPNIASALKEEITRLARREARGQLEPLKKASNQYRRGIAELKRQVARLGQHVSRASNASMNGTHRQTTDASPAKVRFVPKGLRSQRERLGLSAAEYGKLVGVTQQSIYNWESGKTRPRAEQIPVLVSLRALGVREARTRLDQAEKNAPKKRAMATR